VITADDPVTVDDRIDNGMVLVDKVFVKLHSTSSAHATCCLES
jgi:hypothetical protein